MAAFVERKYQDWVVKYGKEMADKLRDKCVGILGDDAELNTPEEVLMALSAVAHHVHETTGDKRYKNIEDVSLSMVDDIGQGLPDEVVAERAARKLKKEKGKRHE